MRPVLSASIWLVWQGRRAAFELTVDTMTPRSVLSTGDFAIPSLPGDDLLSVEGIPGVTLAARYPAFLTFEQDDGTLDVHNLDILVAEGAPGASRLGRDILHEWLMVSDPNGDTLLCQPIRTDG